MRDDIVSILKKNRPHANVGSATKLGEVKDFGQLVNASQRQGMPIDSVSVPGSTNLRSTARAAFQSIAQKIVERAG
jgi:hypothetical protein